MRRYQTKSTYEVEIEVVLDQPLPSGEEVAYPTIGFDFTFYPGYPATGPSWASGGEPGEADHIEVDRAWLIDGAGLTPTQAEIDDWADAFAETATGYQKLIDAIV